MDKQTTIAFVLIGIILVIWLYYSAPDPQVREKKPIDTTNEIIDTIHYPPTENPVTFKPKAKGDKDLNTPIVTEEITTIENDVFLVEMSSKGGNIHKVYLKQFRNWYSQKDNNETDYYKSSVQLINFSKGNTYNLSFVSVDGKAINTMDYFFESDKSPGRHILSGEDSLVIQYKLTKAMDKVKKR